MTLLILHGWGSDKSVWRDLVEKWNKNQHTIAIDMPGFGSEPLISDEWGVPDYARWVENYIVSNQLSNIILLGHSFGGRVASYLAAHKPIWLRGLILSGAPCIYRPSGRIKIRIRIYKLLKLLGLQRLLYSTPDINKADMRGMGKIFRKVVPFDQTKLLKLIDVPTLIIWGSQDDIVPLRIGKEINQLIQYSHLAVIDKAGHSSYLDQPERFKKLVDEFMNGLTRPSG